MLKTATRSALTSPKLACDGKAKLHNDKLVNLEKRLDLFEKIGVLSFSQLSKANQNSKLNNENNSLM